MCNFLLCVVWENSVNNTILQPNSMFFYFKLNNSAPAIAFNGLVNKIHTVNNTVKENAKIQYLTPAQKAENKAKELFGKCYSFSLISTDKSSSPKKSLATTVGNSPLKRRESTYFSSKKQRETEAESDDLGRLKLKRKRLLKDLDAYKYTTSKLKKELAYYTNLIADANEALTEIEEALNA